MQDYLLCIVIAVLLPPGEGSPVMGQPQQKKPSLKDSTDSAFDLSDYIIQANGFVPVPILITEPALGGFGGGIVPVFIKKRPPYIDSVKGAVVRTPVASESTNYDLVKNDEI